MRSSGRWLPQQLDSIDKPVTPATWRAIVEALDNPQQQRIVADDRVRTNVLVLAGPGSGKTRVLVHRIAYLIRVRREDPAGILALAYNRHAASEIRTRLSALVGDQARAVTIMTCHALAMRIVGASFAARSDRIEPVDFDAVLREAAALLRGDGLDRDEAEAQREMLTRGYRWILVDEYQDVGKLEYELIAAIAGRSLDDPDSRLSLFAVGDDDQNIYAFGGASVEYIRRFEADYAARASAPRRELPIDGEHRARRQSRDRACGRADEIGARHHGQPGAPPRAGGRRSRPHRFRRPGPGPGAARGRDQLDTRKNLPA